MAHNDPGEGRRSLPSYRMRRRAENEIVKAQAGFTTKQLQELRVQYREASKTGIEWIAFLESKSDLKRFPKVER